MTLVQIDAQDVDISDALRRELERSVEGEVRFDKLSRALYSTDASVYQIEPAGVLIPKTREDILHALAICRKSRLLSPRYCITEVRLVTLSWAILARLLRISSWTPSAK